MERGHGTRGGPQWREPGRTGPEGVGGPEWSQAGKDQRAWRGKAEGAQESRKQQLSASVHQREPEGQGSSTVAIAEAVPEPASQGGKGRTSVF